VWKVDIPVSRRLLLDSEVVALLEGLPVATRKSIWRRLHQLAESPDRYTDFLERDSRGRDLSVHIFGGYAILYWDDHADRHLKVLEITRADEPED
jgi:hypothetical protein